VAPGVFADLERFLAAHRDCGLLSSEVGKLSTLGYQFIVECPSGHRFDRWVALDDVDEDLLRSRLSAFDN
jgi:hypothetical protein